MLTKAMTSDVYPNKTRLSDTVKLNFGTSSLYCHNCSNAMESMASKSVKLNFDISQPCIAEINVFNGETLVNRFGAQIKSYFPDTFIAILEIELNSNLKQTDVCLGDLNLLVQVEPNQDKYFVCPQFNGPNVKRALEEYDAEETVADCIPNKHQKTWDTSDV
ncbi:uncharacterized protein TNCV_2659711 [Trichonephila clavipes]|uniref:Uncharacterized protein n=1 Tax=Trichonephila clavipes TaxID=2585209 RepID=A0A8X6RDS3_TRICX|nr:uncharacterized protein TNCV_2659711 [Trichonephila clavipes]